MGAVGSCGRCCKDEVDPWEADQVDSLEPDHEPPPQCVSSVPLLLHFDVNKTVLLSDSLIVKSIEDGVREGISELFWGWVSIDENGKRAWEWTGTRPTVDRPTSLPQAPLDTCEMLSYYQFCKEVINDKDERKKAVRSFSLASRSANKAEMEKWLRLALRKMELPKEMARTTQAKEAGLMGSTYVMLPAVFQLVATLHRQGRRFAIVFRSFGDDHEKIRTEWNAFCEMRHPIFSKLLADVGPLDGSVEGLPDRRIKSIHTLYRDAQGPSLILDTFTNGPSSAPWDKWAKAKPKPESDTRGGRAYARETLAAHTVDGIQAMQAWLHDILKREATAAIKDDWAWWQFNEERSEAGKLLPLIPGGGTRQVFFDDNVEHDDPRIVDCRYPDSRPVPPQHALNRLCIKVNPVEALTDEKYFLRKLVRAESGGRPGVLDMEIFGNSMRCKSWLCCDTSKLCAERIEDVRAQSIKA